MSSFAQVAAQAGSQPATSSSSSSSSSSSTNVSDSLSESQDVINRFRELQEHISQLANKIGELDQDRNEHQFSDYSNMHLILSFMCIPSLYFSIIY